MKTVLSPANPFGHTRYGYAFEHVPEGSHCLDFGCHDGWFLNEMAQAKQFSAVGIDKNPEQNLFGRAFGINLPPFLVHVGDRRADLCRGAGVARHREPIELLADGTGSA